MIMLYVPISIFTFISILDINSPSCNTQVVFGKFYVFFWGWSLSPV